MHAPIPRTQPRPRRALLASLLAVLTGFEWRAGRGA